NPRDFEGFQLRHVSVGRCSIQLSYRRLSFSEIRLRHFSMPAWDTLPAPSSREGPSRAVNTATPYRKVIAVSSTHSTPAPPAGKPVNPAKPYTEFSCGSPHSAAGDGGRSGLFFRAFHRKSDTIPDSPAQSLAECRVPGASKAGHPSAERPARGLGCRGGRKDR